MGIVKCIVCKNDCSPFYIWSSSRSFPRQKLLKKLKIKDKARMKDVYRGMEVCFCCYDKLMKEK